MCNSQLLKKEYDDSVIEWFPLKDGKILVKTKDKESVDDKGLSKKSMLKHVT